MAEQLSLAGRVVAVTRAAGEDDALAARLEELGARVMSAPALTVRPPSDSGPLDVALRSLPSIWLVAFASGHAVERTVARAVELGLDLATLRRPLLAAVGSVTAGRVAVLLRRPDLVPAVAGAAGLAELISTGAGVAEGLVGRRVLLPRAAEGRHELRDALAARGAEVLAPPAYRTVLASPEQLRPLVAALDAGEVEAVTLASPSAARALAAALGSHRAWPRTVLASIGPTTSAELCALGHPPDVEAALPTGSALADALARRLGPR